MTGPLLLSVIHRPQIPQSELVWFCRAPMLQPAN